MDTTRSASPWWRPVRALSGSAGRQPVDVVRSAVVCLCLQRVSYLVVAAVTGFFVASRDAPVAGWYGLLVVVHVVWAAWLLTEAWRRQRFRTLLVWLDIGLAVVAEFLLAWLAATDPVLATVDYRTKMDMAAATLAGAALTRGSAVAAIGVLGAGRLGSAWLAGGGEIAEPAVVIYTINSYVWWAAVAWALVRFLRLQADRAQRATARLIAVESRRAAEAERVAQRRRLHDTVLATLTAISRGGLDHRTTEVQQRCAREAEYLRRIVRAEGDSEIGLGAALGDVIEDAEALGLTVRYAGDRTDGQVPPEVVKAFVGATREALNNVLLHSGETNAWVTETTEDGGTVVRIVDRGRGAVAGLGGGRGVRDSIVARLHSVGGHARIDTVAGEGTCVELSWTPR